MLARLGLTVQKPLQRAYQRDPQAIEQWQHVIFPTLAAQARREGAEIFFWDESGFRADAVHGKTWGRRGQTPVVDRPGQRQSISAASAVNSKGAFWFQTYTGALCGELFVELLRKLMHRRKKPVHLVIDGLPAHKTAVVKQYVASTAGRLTLHFLPGYAPELNPDELVWSYAKRTGVARRPLRRGDKLQQRVNEQLQEIADDPALVRSFFGHPSVAYVSDCWRTAALTVGGGVAPVRPRLLTEVSFDEYANSQLDPDAKRLAAKACTCTMAEAKLSSIRSRYQTCLRMTQARSAKER